MDKYNDMAKNVLDNNGYEQSSPQNIRMYNYTAPYNYETATGSDVSDDDDDDDVSDDESEEYTSVSDSMEPNDNIDKLEITMDCDTPRKIYYVNGKRDVINQFRDDVTLSHSKMELYMMDFIEKDDEHASLIYIFC